MLASSESQFRSERGNCTLRFVSGSGCEVRVEGQPTRGLTELNVFGRLRSGLSSVADLIELIGEQTGQVEANDERSLVSVIVRWQAAHYR